jgi:hypothetical protein
MTRNTGDRWYVWLVGAMALVISAPISSRADLMVLDEKGTLDPTTTVNGVAIDTPLNFEFKATFDPRANLDSRPGHGLFAVTSLTFTITVPGSGYLVGTFAAAVPSPNVNVILQKGLFGPLEGLADNTETYGFNSIWNTTTTPFDPSSPTPTSFSGLFNNNLGWPYLIPLQSPNVGIGFRFPPNPTTATLSPLTPGVPEPSTLRVAAISGIVLLVAARRSSRAR